MDRTVERDVVIVRTRNGEIEKSDKNLRSTKTAAAQSTSEPKRRNVVRKVKNVSGRRTNRSTSSKKSSGVEKSVKSDLSFESESSQVNNVVVVESVEFSQQHLVETASSNNIDVDNHLLTNTVDENPFEDHVSSTTQSGKIRDTFLGHFSDPLAPHMTFHFQK